MWAQETYPEVYYYYVEEETQGDLTPLNKITNKQKLNISFENQTLNNFFLEKNIYFFEKVFENSKNDTLKRVYRLGIDEGNLLNTIKALPYVKNATFLGSLESQYATNGEPNDYQNNNYPFANSHLDLINAKQAWSITTGNSNVLVGIIDSNFDYGHEDLTNQVESIHYDGSLQSAHGTRVAGFIAAETNNGKGISSIGYNTKLVLSEFYDFRVEQTKDLAEIPGIKVINLSGGGATGYDMYEAMAYEEVWESGITIVAAAGNVPNEGYNYPASYDHVISVSSVGSTYDVGSNSDPNFGMANWKDVHERVIGNPATAHNSNDKVDICAPGYNLVALNDNNNYIAGRNGTSYATPIVSGVAALMYAVNPTITPDDVKRILKDTAEDIYQIPENQPYIGLLGAGRVNAYAAVLQAKCEYNPTPGLDLMMQNSDNDFGIEPDTVTNPIWNSPDIWVRNQPDGHIVQEHQDLHYVSNQIPVYVYVKVTNNSCETSLGTEELKLYWAKGGISQDWPTIWEGATGGPGNLQIGDDVGNLNIPVLEPGESTILEFEWQPYDPEVYQADGYAKPWMFCFLARIVTPNDPMTFTEVTNASTNAKNNNNIAYKNTTVLNVTGGPKGTITAGNYFSESPTVADFNFFTIDANDTNIWEQAEISIELDDTIWDNWLSNDGQGSNYEIVNEEEHRILLTGNHAQLTNVPFGPDEGGLITLEVNFLTDEVDSQDNFALHIEQYDASRDESKGGFTFNVRRDVSRPDFEAEGERERINNLTTLNANSINEPATYNWYDSNGDLVYSGEQLTVTSPIAQEYKLEIIANSDGHKDYAMVNSESPYTLESLSPNPANNDQVQVNYKAEGAVSGYISITSTQTAVSNNYILNANDPNLSIDVSTYSPGTYVVALICDGEIIETKNLIIQ